MAACLKLTVGERRQQKAGVVVLPAAGINGADPATPEHADQACGKLGARAIVGDDDHPSRPSLNRVWKRWIWVETAAGRYSVAAARERPHQWLEQLVNGDQCSEPELSPSAATRGLGARDVDTRESDEEGKGDQGRRRKPRAD
jgi:hypothetical protein